MFLFSSSRLSFSIYILCFLNLYSAEVPKAWLCADASCSAPISEATVQKPYWADSTEKISVTQGEKLEILKKPADGSNKYYFVRTKGREQRYGLLKVDFFKEKTIMVRKENLVKVESTVESSKNKTPDTISSAPSEIIDGTLLPLEPSYSYEPTRDNGRNFIGSPGAVQSTTPPSNEASLNGKSKIVKSASAAGVQPNEIKEGNVQPHSENHSNTPQNSSTEQRDTSQVEQKANTQSTNKTETKIVSRELDGEQESKLNDYTPTSTSNYHTPATNSYDSLSNKGYDKDVAATYGTTGSATTSPQSISISTQIDESQTPEKTTSGEEVRTKGVQSNKSVEGNVQPWSEYHSNPLKMSSTERNESSQAASNPVEQEMDTQSTIKNETNAKSEVGTVKSSAVKSVASPSSENSQKVSGGEQESKTNDTMSFSSSEEVNGASADEVQSNESLERNVQPQSEHYSNASTEQSESSQVASNPVDQKMDTQSTIKNETNAESEVGPVSESSTNHTGVSSAVGSVAPPSSENSQKVSGGEQELKTNDTMSFSSGEEVNGASADELQSNESLERNVQPQSEYYSKASTEQSESSQAASNPVDQKMDTQSTIKYETNVESEVGTVSESSTNHTGIRSSVGSVAPPLSENSQKVSGGEQELKTNDTMPFSSGEEVNGASAAAVQSNESIEGNVQPQSEHYSNPSTEQSESSQAASNPVEQEVDSESRTESKGNVSGSINGDINIGSNSSEESAVHTKNLIEHSIHSTDDKSHSLSTSHQNIYTHHHNEQLTSPMSLVSRLASHAKDSSVEVPESATVHNPTNIPATTQPQDFVSEVNVDVTTTPMPSPSQPPESDPSTIVEPNSEVQENTFEELPHPIQEDSVSSWYSSVGSIFTGMQEMFLSGETESDIIPSEVAPKLQVDGDAVACTTNTCDIQPQIDLGIEKDNNHQIIDYVWMSPGGITLMIISAIAVLLFSLGYYYLENLRRDVELVTKYNDLAGKLFIEQKEKEMLAEKLTTVNESMSQMSYDSTKYDEELSELKTRLQKYKEEKSAIEEKEKETRKKFMMVDKNYNELRNILSQNKQKGERSALILDIKNLKDSIAGNNVEIASLKEQLLEKKEEIKSLNTRIMEFLEANKQLERNVENAISEKHETAQKYQDNIARLERTIEENTVARVKLEKECAQLKKEKESLAIEKELAESSLQKFQRLKPSNALTEWLDAKEVRVSLLAAEKKIAELTSIRDELTRNKNLAEEKEKTLVVDFEQLNEKYEKAEKEKIEALTKLQVLSDYFKEKETQLQEELGTKESLWLQKQSDDRTIYEQMRSLREENASFKNQNETLKREILDQEASFKKLITSSEEKAHENWVALRHQERRLKEAQMEAAQLRSRLTTLESAGDHSDDKINKGEVNGDMPPYGSATSPPFMLYPEFVPPPPLLTTTPSRPPPLGRISSPPLGDFTPPPPLVPYEMFLPPSPPPPAPHVLHKPQPLDGSHRIQKDSQSSNHSSESAPDRTRRNKR